MNSRFQITSIEGAHTTVDAFAQVLGTQRGLTDADGARELLAATERELAAAHAELKLLRAHNDTLDHAARALKDKIGELGTELTRQRRALALTRRDRDSVLYAAIWADLPDPLIVIEPEQHQGIWTAGRPYRVLQHCYYPDPDCDGETVCWEAHIAPVPAGRRPGRSPLWRRCAPVYWPCPVPETIGTTPHPASSGYALRQDRYWWDMHNKRWGLQELTREHLLGVIDWLEADVNKLWSEELNCAPDRVPCPAVAYRSSQDWLADTPLMRALIEEKRRRRIRRSRRRDADDWAWADDL